MSCYLVVCFKFCKPGASFGNVGFSIPVHAVLRRYVIQYGRAKSCITLRSLNYGNYGIVLIMGNAGFCPSAVWQGKGSLSNIAILFYSVVSRLIILYFHSRAFQ